MTFLLARWRLIVSLIGLLGGLYILWQVHDYLASARVTKAMEAAQEQKKADTKKEVRWLNKEQEIGRSDAEILKKARQSATLSGYSDSPDLPAEYLRMLDAIGAKADPARASDEGVRATNVE